jgi:hypothetical protein
MEHEHFIIGYRFMHEANISQAMAHFCLKSKDWIEENIPLVSYEQPIYNFIRSTGTCLGLQSDVMIYEVNGQWQRIICKS